MVSKKLLKLSHTFFKENLNAVNIDKAVVQSSTWHPSLIPFLPRLPLLFSPLPPETEGRHHGWREGGEDRNPFLLLPLRSSLFASQEKKGKWDPLLRRRRKRIQRAIKKRRVAPLPPSSKISSFFGVSVLEMGEEWVVELAGKREKTHAHILCGALDWL